MANRIGVCEDCATRYRIPETFQGSTAKCKKCGGVVRIKTASSGAAPEKPAAAKPPSSKPAAKAKAPARAAAPKKATASTSRRSRSDDTEASTDAKPARRAAGSKSKGGSRRAAGAKGGRAGGGRRGSSARRGGSGRRGSSSSKKGMSPMVMGGGALVIVLAAVGGWMMMGGDDEGSSTTQSASAKQVEADAANAAEVATEAATESADAAAEKAAESTPDPVEAATPAVETPPLEDEQPEEPEEEELVTVVEFEELPRNEGTSDEDWEAIEAAISGMEDGGKARQRHMKKLVEFELAAMPALLNTFNGMDLSDGLAWADAFEVIVFIQNDLLYGLLPMSFRGDFTDEPKIVRHNMKIINGVVKYWRERQADPDLMATTLENFTKKKTKALEDES